MRYEIIKPIDYAIKLFYEHLNAHDKTILSAMYGDGKTIYLQRTFLTISIINLLIS